MRRFFCGNLEDLPEALPLETATTPKKKKFFADRKPKNSKTENVWSSEEKNTSTTPSTPRKRISPAQDIGCGATRRTRTPKAKRCLFPSSSVTPPSDNKITAFHYGSEEEYEDEEEEATQCFLGSRVISTYTDVENEKVEEGSYIISFDWPRQSPPTLDFALTLDSPTPSPLPLPTTDIKPSNKFFFEWGPFPKPQIAPHLRRELFSQINTGPTVSFTNPYKAFTAIWDREIMEVIVTETNKYAEQLATGMLENGTMHPYSRISRWHDTNVNELYTYLAIVLAMGVVVKSQQEEYWKDSKNIFSTSGFSTKMSLGRFLLLTKCLHFNNNKNFDYALLTPAEAKLYKIQPILDHLNGKFSQLYNLSQNVALDESLTMWKGRLDINQFIPNKAAAIGIKTYEICESRTGYLWRFEVHAGHDTLVPKCDDPVSGKIPSLVLRLLNGLEHKGHTVWMDNYYNSPALARELKVRGFDCVGTLRTNRRLVPSELANINKNDMVVGEIVGCTSGDVDLIVWKDKKQVALISTYHGLAVTKSGDVLKPTVVHDYNICMGGVDLKDQQLAMYPIERKRTKVWYKKFFRRLLNVSVLNSYILMNRSLTHRAFRKALIIDLLTAHGPVMTTSFIEPKIIQINVHSPAQYDFVWSGKSYRHKYKCAVCNKRTSTYCKTCNEPMCVFTCYEPYHTLPRL